MFGRCVFNKQSDGGIPLETNYAPLPSDLLLYLYEANFVQELLMKNEKKPSLFLNFTLINMMSSHYIIQNR